MRRLLIFVVLSPFVYINEVPHGVLFDTPVIEEDARKTSGHHLSEMSLIDCCLFDLGSAVCFV